MSRRAVPLLMLATSLLCACRAPAAPAPLVAAARAGQPAVIALLVRRGADPDRPSGGNGWTPLMHAIHKDRADSVRALLAAGADPNRGIGWGFTPLMMAAGNGSLPIVDILLEAGADPRARRGDGTTALTLAVAGGALTDIERPLLGACHTEVVKALLRRAPDLRQDRPRGLDLSRVFARLNGCDEVLRLTANP